ncbi:MAG: DNA adenine methylase [Bacteroides sp.]|nr:DNA adenine methylase [Bacteroides sp.]
MIQQYTLFPEVQARNAFPSTRYQGSKAKFVDWIWHEISKIPFHTALDAFGGTGCVAYKMKDNGKAVTYNDILPFNAIIGKALIENNYVTLDDDEVDNLFVKQPYVSYPTFIADNFHDIYYTDEENHWLDIVRYNISSISNEYKRAIAWFALFQACIIKRPYNLFHRKNLYVRLSDVKRSFGNKKTWDTPFEIHFKAFVKEANRAIFSNGETCEALNMDAKDISQSFDLVYIDTPYLNESGVGVDYADFYHFLNGLVYYDDWGNLIDYGSKHRRIKRTYSVWNDKERIFQGFKELIDKFSDSVLAISYRSNGLPSIDSLLFYLNNLGRRTELHYSRDMKYVLSDRKSQEVLIISRP